MSSSSSSSLLLLLLLFAPPPFASLKFLLYSPHSSSSTLFSQLLAPLCSSSSSCINHPPPPPPSPPPPRNINSFFMINMIIMMLKTNFHCRWLLRRASRTGTVSIAAVHPRRDSIITPPSLEDVGLHETPSPKSPGRTSLIKSNPPSKTKDATTNINSNGLQSGDKSGAAHGMHVSTYAPKDIMEVCSNPSNEPPKWTKERVRSEETGLDGQGQKGVSATDAMMEFTRHKRVSCKLCKSTFSWAKVRQGAGRRCSEARCESAAVHQGTGRRWP